MENNSIYKNFIGALIAGVFIGIGCVVNAKLGGIIGAVLFSTGLVTIIKFKFPLFTGIVADKLSMAFFTNAFIVLLGNASGALLISILYSPIMPEVILPNHSIFILSCGTGLLMVAAYKSKSSLIAIMGVTLFIMCGWFHCIAEIGYGRLSSSQWCMAFLGNIVGGQLFRLYDLIDDCGENKNE